MSAVLTRPKPAPRTRPAAAVSEPTVPFAGEAAEMRRWLLTLGIPFAVSAACFAVAIGTGLLWMIAPAMAIGPGLIIAGFIYLSLTCEANSVG